MNEVLYRPLLKGNQYHSLFPSTTCEIVALGKGDTDYSIDKMVEWIFLHQHQTEKISKLLAKSSLQNTCKSNHDFLFNHFQYKADLDDQLLRSPACAWKQRHDGIDCKSYSIIASCLLLNQNITHYIRKVGYNAVGEYTHVYVIIPINQKTNNLNDGYYMIDGTINTMQEPENIDFKDELMLNHIGLQKPNQLGAINLQSLKKLNITSVVSFFQNISCWGGSAYGGTELNMNIVQTTNVYNEIVADINLAIQNNNTTELSLAVNEFLGITTRLVQGATIAKAERSWNSCSGSNFTAFINFVTYFKNNIYPTLIQFLDQYYTKSQNGNTIVSSYALNWEGWQFSQPAIWQPYEEQIPIYTFTRKASATQIAAFEFVAPIVAGIETQQAYSTQSALALMQTVINTVNPNNNNPIGSGPNNNNPIGNNPIGNDPYYTNPGSQAPAKTAGFTTIAAVVLLAVGLGYAFTQTPSKPTPIKPTSRQTKKQTVK